MVARYMLSSCASPSVRLSVRLSFRRAVTSWYCIETNGRIELFLAWGLLSTHPTLCYKEICVPPEIRVLSFVTLSQTPDFKNFATTGRWRCPLTRRRRQRSTLLTTPI